MGNRMACQEDRPEAFATARWFSTTHWSVVLAASRHTDAALEQLCRQYWPPVYAFVRRRGHGPEEAQDLTQEFFARLLEKNYLNAADPAKGRFRTLLLTAVSRFLVNQYDRAQAQKRGGGEVHFSLDADVEEGRIASELHDANTPEVLYERRWAETLLERVLTRLREEFTNSGEAVRFELLKPFLAAEKNLPSGATVAAKLGISETAVYSAVHRIRRRYGELLRKEVAHTVASPDEIEEELRYLLRVLSG
jgi:RNA polymerase sigma-70 factor (ECF subfamily)